MLIGSLLFAVLSALPTHVLAIAAHPEGVHVQSILKSKPEFASTKNDSGIELDFLSSAPLIFGSLRSLLRQWPSVYGPNGHSIVPGIVPSGTKIYHTRLDADLPPSPEWLAFDIEMANFVFGGWRTSHLLTYRITKPTMVLYFDGMSAAAYGGIGQLDSQALVIDHKTSRPPVNESAEHENARWAGEELHRAYGLCDWITKNGVGGPGWGIEGIVRMNAGFELIWCDFESPSIKLLSHINITAPLVPGDILRHKYPPYRNLLPQTGGRSRSSEHEVLDDSLRWREPFLNVEQWDCYRAAIWHSGKEDREASVGEYRVKPLTCGMTSYYEAKFASISESRKRGDRLRLNLTEDGHWIDHGQDRQSAMQSLHRRRRQHDLQASTESDAISMNQDVRDVLVTLVERANQAGSYSMQLTCSGPDWTAIASDIGLRYGQPLRQWIQVFDQAIASVSQQGVLRSAMLAMLRDRAHFFLLPFLEYPSSAFCQDVPCGNFEEDQAQLWTLSSPVGQVTLEQCRRHYDELMSDHEVPYLLPGDRLLGASIAGTMDGICRIIIDVGFGVEHLWLSNYGNWSATTRTTSPNDQRSKIQKELLALKEKLEELQAWLGWVGDDVACEPSCGHEELCYVPIWPLLDFRNWNMSFTAWNFEGSLVGSIPHWSEYQWDPVCLKSLYFREDERFVN